jgi:hypothetical protein
MEEVSVRLMSVSSTLGVLVTVSIGKTCHLTKADSNPPQP